MSTGERIDRADVRMNGRSTSPLGLVLGCLWVGGAFAVLIYTLSAANQFRPIGPASEMAISDRVMAAEPPSR